MKTHCGWRIYCDCCLCFTILLCVGWYNDVGMSFQFLRRKLSPFDIATYQYYASKPSVNRGFFMFTAFQYKNTGDGMNNVGTEKNKTCKRNYICNNDSMWLDHEYKVDHELSYNEEDSAPTNIIEVLTKSSFYSSKTQARKACERGAVLILSDKSGYSQGIGIRQDNWYDKIYNITSIIQNDKVKIGNCRSLLQKNDVVLIQTRLSPGRSRSYPVEVTKNILPPFLLISSFSETSEKKINYSDDKIISFPSIQVMYEDEYVAVVNKPENITTIIHSNGRSKSKNDGKTSEVDLQSLLGFVLHPSLHELSYHPRPIHRLDRRTSGLILVAKTKDAMRYYSQAFSSHTKSIIKTYTALVFHRLPHTLAANENPPSIENDKDAMYNSIKDSMDKEWKEIDYPIDGKFAKSIWRYSNHYSNLGSNFGTSDEEETSSFSESSDEQHSIYKLSLLQVRPLTGRMHQIRRHLSYCLSLPIVGDAKYDKGARALRTNGMYLCCHSLKFPLYHTSNIEASKTHQVEVPLPPKFYHTFQRQGQ